MVNKFWFLARALRLFEITKLAISIQVYGNGDIKVVFRAFDYKLCMYFFLEKMEIVKKKTTLPFLTQSGFIDTTRT